MKIKTMKPVKTNTVETKTEIITKITEGQIKSWERLYLTSSKN